MASLKDQQRLKAILKGAFAGPPTPLKDIPKRSGESRLSKRGGASSASAKTASRGKKNLA